MYLFGTNSPKDDEELPSYVLVDRLPSDAGAHLLGLIVAEFKYPMSQYCPSKIKVSKALQPGTPALVETLNSEELQVEDADYNSLFSTAKNKIVEAKVGKIFRSPEMQATLPLLQLRALMTTYRAEVLDLIRARKDGTAYMIVGFKTIVNGKYSKKQDSHRMTTMRAELPVDKVIQGATKGAFNPGDALNPEIKKENGQETALETSSSMLGEQIFAIRYRILTYKKSGHRNKKEDVEYGDIKLYRKEDAVYGEEEDDEDPQYGEDEFNDGNDFDDEDIALSNEGMNSYAEKLDVDADVVKFEI